MPLFTLFLFTFLQGLGLTALAAMTPEDGPINPAEICPLIPPQSGERWKSPETDLTRIFLDVLLELMVTQIPLIEWKDEKNSGKFADLLLNP